MCVPIALTLMLSRGARSGVTSPWLPLTRPKHLTCEHRRVVRLKSDLTDGLLGRGDGSVRGVLGYAFRLDCWLRSLIELEAPVRGNHHPPDLPSEEAVIEKTVSLRLLARIEELTLTMIRERNRNDSMVQQKSRTPERIARLESLTKPTLKGNQQMIARFHGVVRTRSSRCALAAAIVCAAYFGSPAWGQWSTTSNGIYYNGGNVGVGTPNPQSLLHVYNRNDTSVATIGIDNDGSGTNTGQALQFRYGGLGEIGALYHQWDGSRWNLRLKAWNGGASTERLTIQGNTGNVGIGTTNPTSRVEIDADNNFSSGSDSAQLQLAGGQIPISVWRSATTRQQITA